MKKCFTCGTEKPLEDFYQSNKSNCKACCRIYAANWSKKHYKQLFWTKKKQRRESYDRTKPIYLQAYPVTIQQVSEKFCNKCHQVKSISEFHKDCSSRDGVRRRCRSCNIKDQREWAKNNPFMNRFNKKQYNRSPKGKARSERYRVKNLQQSA
jgi:hypothetical protein